MTDHKSIMSRSEVKRRRILADNKTILAVRISKENKRFLQETVGALIVIFGVCLIGGMLWAFKACMGWQQ